MATTVYPYTQYGGIWKLNAASAAVGAGTWAKVLQPYLYDWGGNSSGALGLGNTTNYSSPKQVGALTNWSSVSFARFHGLAVKTDGTLWAWGNNSKGQLGNSSTTNYSSPIQIGALTNWLQVAGGQYNSFAVKTDGTLWSWGQNNYGQLGLNNKTYYSSPVQIGALSTWSYVSCGSGNINNFNVFLINTDGTLWGWGRSSPIPSYPNSSPVQIGSATNWLKVCAGRYFATGIQTDGTIWSWGTGGVGQLGLGATTYVGATPTQIGVLTSWLDLSCGYSHTVAIKSNGTAWSWGSNSSGQLGLGDTTNRSSPTQIGGLTNWLSVSCGYCMALSRKTDGTLWSWGQNGNGQLGLGNQTYFSSPKQIGTLSTWSSKLPTYNFYRAGAFLLN